MKRTDKLWLAAALLAALALWGCSKKEPPAEEAEGKKPRYYEREVGKNPILAPTDYLYVATVRAPRHAKEVVFLADLSNQIKQFWALNSRYPESLKELEEWRGAPVPQLPKGLGYDYNPETGELKAVQVPLEDE